MSTPNLLFLFTDEQRYDTLAAYGNTRIEMPNLNRLAEQSVVFDRAYVTQPVCTPSRSTLLTGLYPHTTGLTENNIPLPENTPCLPEMLGSGAYKTAYFGKWHLGDEIFRQHGFDEWISIEDMYLRYYSKNRDRNARSSYHHFLLENGYHPNPSSNLFGRSTTAQFPEEHSKPAFLAEEASRFIRENNGHPFVLFVNFLEPHMPFFGPRDCQYDPSDIVLPENFNAFLTENQPLKAHLLAEHYRVNGRGTALRTEKDWRRIIARYWGLNSLVDTHAGRILKTLEECGLYNETIIVYTSDHGDMMGSHRLIAKCLMFEEAVRVPMMIKLQHQTSRKRITRPVSQVDMVPTLLDLLGHPVDDKLQGRSLKPELEGRPEEEPGNVFIEWSGGKTGIPSLSQFDEDLPENLAKLGTVEDYEASSTDHIRTILTPEGLKFNMSQRGEHELYDLNRDYAETNNLAAAPTMRPKIEELAVLIREWQTRMDDIIEPLLL